MSGSRWQRNKLVGLNAAVAPLDGIEHGLIYPCVKLCRLQMEVAGTWAADKVSGSHREFCEMEMAE